MEASFRGTVILGFPRHAPGEKAVVKEDYHDGNSNAVSSCVRVPQLSCRMHSAVPANFSEDKFERRSEVIILM